MLFLELNQIDLDLINLSLPFLLKQLGSISFLSTYINVFVQKFKSNSKTSTSTGICFDFIIFN